MMLNIGFNLFYMNCHFAILMAIGIHLARHGKRMNPEARSNHLPPPVIQFGDGIRDLL